MRANPAKLTKQKVISALAQAHADLAQFPAGNRVSLLRLPYRGIIQGITIEGSPEGYTWRVVVFAFPPVEAATSLHVCREPDFEFWWDGRDGSLMHGHALLTKLLSSQINGPQNLLTSIGPLYESAFRPWLAARDTPALLLKHMPRPHPVLDQEGVSNWTLSKISEAIRYSQRAIAADMHSEAIAVLETVLTETKPDRFDEKMRLTILRRLAEAETISAVACGPASARHEWIQAREEITLSSLKLPLNFLNARR